MPACLNVAACEQDSGFEDLIKCKIEDADYIAVEIQNELPQQQHFPNDSQEKLNTTKATANSNNTYIANEAKLLSIKRGAGRPPKRHDNQFECESCPFSTAYATQFRLHLSEAHQMVQVRIFKCLYCTEAYVEERFLREHIKHIHDCIPKRPKLICDECGKGFPKQSHLIRHSYVHKPNEKPFLCEHCSKRFPNQSSLMRHVDARHVKEKPHACEMCGKAFGHIYALKAHKIHMHLVKFIEAKKKI